MKLHISTIVVIALCLGISGVSGVCPRTTQAARFLVGQCTAPVTATVNYFTADGLVRLCNFSEAIVGCVQGLIRDCESVSEERVRTINSIIDIPNLNASLATVCSDIDAKVESAASCFVSEAINASLVCLSEVTTDFLQILRDLTGEVANRGFTWLEREQAKASCRHASNLGNCSNVFLEPCGADIQQMYFSLFTAVRTPNCETILSQPSDTNQGVTDGCPPTARDAIFEITKCTLPFLSLITFRTGLPSLATLNSFCSISATEMSSCLGKLISCSTTHPHVAQAMRSINGPALRDFVNLACANGNLFASQGSCVEQKSEVVNACVVEDNDKYLAEVQTFQQALQAGTRSRQWYQQMLLMASCQFAARLQMCINPINFGCDYKIGEVYNSLIIAASSPLCATLPTPTEAPTTTTTTTIAPPAGGFGGEEFGLPGEF